MDLPTVKTYGMAEVASNVVFDPEVGFGGATSAILFSKDRWESLPLVARQLLWDRLPVFATGLVEHRTWPDFQAGAQSVVDAGGSVVPFAPDARAALKASNDKIIEQLADSDAIDDGATYVESARDLSDEWKTELEDLGFSAETDFQSWAEEYDGGAGEVDLELYASTFQEMLNEFRPGEQ
jgi:hypothetical protein